MVFSRSCWPLDAAHRKGKETGGGGAGNRRPGQPRGTIPLSRRIDFGHRPQTRLEGALHPSPGSRQVFTGKMDRSFGARELIAEFLVLNRRGPGPGGAAPGVVLPRVRRAGHHRAGDTGQELPPVVEYALHAGIAFEAVEFIRAGAVDVGEQDAFRARRVPGGMPEFFGPIGRPPAVQVLSLPEARCESGRIRAWSSGSENRRSFASVFAAERAGEKRMLERSGTGTVTSTLSDSQVRPFRTRVLTVLPAAMSVTGDPVITRSPSEAAKAAGRRSLPPRIFTKSRAFGKKGVRRDRPPARRPGTGDRTRSWGRMGPVPVRSEVRT